MDPQATFENEETSVPERSNLFIFSDGAYEITQPDDTMWTLQDFARTLEASDPSEGLTPLDGVETTIRRVRSADHFEDDVSLLEVRFGK
jgi:sigma-B regulation protein RsbU (phosphoserine phosphatase)